MHHRRNNRIAFFASLLFALSLLAGRQAPLWRNADGTLCRTCTFASDRRADDCCDTGGADAVVSRDCRDCCIASNEDAVSPRRDLHRALVITAPPAPACIEAALPWFVERPAIYTFPLVHAARSTPPGSPGLRAPPFSG